MRHHSILVVDDDPYVTAGLQKALRAQPFDVLAANSGLAGLRVLASHAVSVAISDEQMPGMTGAEFLARVRQLHPSTVRVILTGHASTEAAIRAINQGEVYRYLTKPINAAELAATVRQAIVQHELLETSRRLLRQLRQQNALLDTLERLHPGISETARDPSGAYVLDDCDYDADELLKQMERELGLATPPGR